MHPVYSFRRKQVNNLLLYQTKEGIDLQNRVSLTLVNAGMKTFANGFPYDRKCY